MLLKILACYCLLALGVSAFILYGVLLPDLISSADSLWVAIGAGLGIGTIPIFAIAFRTLFKSLILEFRKQ